jgi:hypothetical protein
MVEWSKDHVAAIGPLNSTHWFNCLNLVKLETGQALRWKGETTGWEGQRVGISQASPSKVVSPPVSVKD